MCLSVFFSIDMCFTNQQVPNSLLDALLVISIIGIASILLYWVSVGYTVYKQSTTEGKILQLYMYRLIFFMQETKPSFKQCMFSLSNNVLFM